MSNFGGPLFNGSRFIFWSLGPNSLVCGIGVLVAAPFAFADRSWLAAVTLSLLGLCGVCFFLALLNAQQFRWAPRVVTGIVALTYLFYVVDTYFIEGQSLSPAGRRSAASPGNANLGVLAIGLPCVWFTIFGRFGRPEEANKAPEPTP